MSETPLSHALQIEASKRGHRLFRNNVGFCKNPILRYGLCPGSSDLIGLTSILVTPPMYGQRIAVFTAVEVKTETGRSTPAQRAFIDSVRQLGGIGIIARKLDDYSV